MSSTEESFHAGSVRPMDSLQGTDGTVHTQAPMEAPSMTNPRSAAPDNVNQTWNSSSLESTPSGVPANSNPVH